MMVYDFWVLNLEVVLERVQSTPYLSPSELCSQTHRHLWMVYACGSLIWKWCWREWSLLHIYLLLNCVHKHTDIYNGISLWALNWKVVFESVESTPYLSPHLCSQIHRHL